MIMKKLVLLSANVTAHAQNTQSHAIVIVTGKIQSILMIIFFLSCPNAK